MQSPNGNTNSSYPQSPYGGYTSPTAGSYSAAANPSLRRRAMPPSLAPLDHSTVPESPMRPGKAAIRKLDFMFPKVDTEYTVQTGAGGVSSLAALLLIFVLCTAETVSWMYQNNETVEHLTVDTALSQKMRVHMNITFPALACEDLHVDVMDVAGDSQLNILDTLVKKRLDLAGYTIDDAVIKAEANAHQAKLDERTRALQEGLPEDYCGPCYGAASAEGECCNTCDELLAAYQKKEWRSEVVQMTSEQCIREGRDKLENKKLKKGEGCNISGYLRVNRVAGNFHIALGEGIERDGRHIHQFNPEETQDFNASHVIHSMGFGPTGVSSGFGDQSQVSLANVKKIVSHEHGTTGLFQYFIKVVPTTFYPIRGGRPLQTNAYHFTERFRPLMREYLPELMNPRTQDDESDPQVAVQAGHGSKTKQDQHNIKNAVLPGVFFIYEIYPFAVEIRKQSVPLTHLLIRIMATAGGVLTLLRMADAVFLSRRDLHRR